MFAWQWMYIFGIIAGFGLLGEFIPKIAKEAISDFNNWKRRMRETNYWRNLKDETIQCFRRFKR